MKMALLTLLTPLFLVGLVGCACNPKVVTETVEVPVMVTCIKETPARPEFPLQISNPNEDLFVLTKRALAEIELRKGYEGELEAVLTACKETPTIPK
jgi:hypothetical protein